MPPTRPEPYLRRACLWFGLDLSLAGVVFGLGLHRASLGFALWQRRCIGLERAVCVVEHRSS
jgi:hypothetical protein